jgi:hypothetical protein
MRFPFWNSATSMLGIVCVFKALEDRTHSMLYLHRHRVNPSDTGANRRETQVNIPRLPGRMRFARGPRHVLRALKWMQRIARALNQQKARSK